VWTTYAGSFSLPRRVRREIGRVVSARMRSAGTWVARGGGDAFGRSHSANEDVPAAVERRRENGGEEKQGRDDRARVVCKHERVSSRPSGCGSRRASRAHANFSLSAQLGGEEATLVVARRSSRNTVEPCIAHCAGLRMREQVATSGEVVPAVAVPRREGDAEEIANPVVTLRELERPAASRHARAAVRIRVTPPGLHAGSPRRSRRGR